MKFFQKDDLFHHDFEVNQRIYSGFGELFSDHNPLHTDSVFAQSKGFPECVMYGNILNGFLSYFIGEMMPTKDVIIHSQEIQFKKPVFLNDTLHFEAKVSDIFDSVHTVEFKYQFKEETRGVVAKGKIQIGVWE